MNLALVISTSTRKFEGKHGHRCNVELNNELDARGVMLNLGRSSQLRYGSLRKSNCQRFNIELGSNSITIRGVVLNLTVICQRCNVNLTIVKLRYEQF